MIRRPHIALTLALLLLGRRELAAQEQVEPPPGAAHSLEPHETETGGEEPPDDLEGGVATGAPTVSLPEAIRIAFERNYDILSAHDAVSAAQYRERAVFAQFLPQFVPRAGRAEGITSYGLEGTQRLPWTGGSVSASGLLSSRTSAEEPFSRSATARVQLTQPLLRGVGPSATFYELRNSRRSVEVQARSLVLTGQRVAIQVTAAFYAVVAQRQLVVVSRQSWKRTLELQRASEARLKVGLASKLDVFRAELQASQTEEALVRQQAALQTSLEQFRSLLALSPSDPLEPEAVELPQALPAESEPVAALVARALGGRLELAEARSQVEDARRAVSVARQSLLPQLDLNLVYSRQGLGSSFGDGWKAADDRLFLGFSTSYPLDRSGEKARAAEAALELTARERTAMQREQQVEADVRSAHRELERLRKSFELQRKSVEAATRQQKLASLRYQRGLASNFDVVDAEGSLLFARSALVSLLVSYKVAEIDLRRAVGSLDALRESAP